MSHKLWIIGVVVWTVSAGIATVEDPRWDHELSRAVTLEAAPALPDHDQGPGVNSEAWAEAKRKEFNDRLNDVQDWEFDLDNQSVDISEEISALQCELEQNRLALERVKVDQKYLRRNLDDLTRERITFEQQDELRKAKAKTRSGN